MKPNPIGSTSQDIWLDAGEHKAGGRQGCVMEFVGVKWLMQHGFTLQDAWDRLTDQPACTDPMIWRAAQTVNDRLTDSERQRLVPLIDRLARCHTPTDPMKAKRVRVRVACWSARSVLDLNDDDERRAIALRAIETAEAWLRGEATEKECADAVYAYATTTTAAAAAYAATATAATATAAAAAAAAYATYAATAATTTAAATAAAAAHATRDLVLWLDELLDQWEKAAAEEGTLSDAPPVPSHQ